MRELYQQCSTSKKRLHTVVKSVELVVADVVSAEVVEDVVSVLVVVPCWYWEKKVHIFRYVRSDRGTSQLWYTSCKLHLIKGCTLTVVVPVELVEDVGSRHPAGWPWQTSPIIKTTMQQTNQCRDDNEWEMLCKEIKKASQEIKLTIAAGRGAGRKAVTRNRGRGGSPIITCSCGLEL